MKLNIVFCNLILSDQMSDFDMTQMTCKLKAPKNTYVEEYLMKDDPRELYIALNEFCFHIDQDKDMLQACYWIEWILLFDYECNKKKKSLKCERRVFAPVKSNDQLYVIWIVWDIFLQKANSNKFRLKIIQSLMELFSLRTTLVH